MSAELERLRSLLNAQPAELSEAQVDALAEAGNRAVADSLHERLCHCDRWPDACVAGHEMTTWDTGAYDTAVPAIVGLWESMRADAVPAELKRLKARVSELEAERHSTNEAPSSGRSPAVPDGGWEQAGCPWRYPTGPCALGGEPR